MNAPVKNYNTKRNRILIVVLTVVIGALVTLMQMMPAVDLPEGVQGFFNSLPAFNACVNSTTFFVLIASLIAIKKGNIQLHKKLILAAMFLSVLFLMSYVSYHITHTEARYPKGADYRTLYLIILNAHIVLSGIIVPMVLLSFIRGMSMQVEKHKKLAKITLPIWLFVTASGVVVYFMISPYYAF